MMHFEIYMDLCRTRNKLLFEEKKCFYFAKIEECRKDQKKLFKLTKNVMRSNSNVNLPRFSSAGLVADMFSFTFISKTTIIRNKSISDFPNTNCNISMDTYIMFNGMLSYHVHKSGSKTSIIIINGNMLEMFGPASVVEVKEIITKSLNKSYDLDPLATWLLNKCVDQLLPLIIPIIIRSVNESVMLLCLNEPP